MITCDGCGEFCYCTKTIYGLWLCNDCWPSDEKGRVRAAWPPSVALRFKILARYNVNGAF